MLIRIITVLSFLCLAFSLALLARFYDLSIDLLPHETNPEIAIALLWAVLSLSLGWLTGHYSKFFALARATSWPIIVNALIIVAIFFPPGAYLEFGDHLFASYANSLLDGSLIYVLQLLAAAAALNIVLHLSEVNSDIRGYKSPLKIAHIGLVAGNVLPFFDTLRYASLMLLSAALLGVCLCILRPAQPRLSLSSMRSRRVFVGGLFALPVSIAVAPLLLGFFQFIYINQDIWSAISQNEITTMEKLPDDTAVTTLLPANTKQLTRTTTFSAAAFIGESKTIAVEGTQVYLSDDLATTWTPFHKVATTDNQVEFASNGQLGWIGDPYEEIQLTHDGGTSWEIVNLDTIYTDTTGKESDSEFINHGSDIHIDLSNGYGAFTLNCMQLTTKDFGKNWKAIEIQDGESKRICLADNPYSLNKAQDRLVRFSLGSEKLMALEDGQWTIRCAINPDNSFFSTDQACEEITLNNKDQQFLDKYQGFAKRHETLYPSEKHISQILAEKSLPVADLNQSVQLVAGRHWTSSAHFLASSTDSGKHWAVHYYQPRLKRILPVSRSVAIALSENEELLISKDSGETWRAIRSSNDSTVHDIYVNSKQEQLWMLIDNQVVSYDISKEQSKTVLTMNINQDYSFYDNLKFQVSSDGQRMWIYLHDAESRRMHYSNDQGDNWQLVELMSPPMEKDKVAAYFNDDDDEYDHILEMEIQLHLDGDQPWVLAIDCPVNTLDCYSLDELHRIRQIRADPQALRYDDHVISTLPDTIDTEYHYGLFRAHQSGNEFLYIEYDTHEINLTVENGKKWRTRPLHVKDEWTSLRYTADGNALILQGVESAAVSRDFGQHWRPINPTEWDTPMQTCFNSNAETIIAYSDYEIAVTGDAGNAWKRQSFYEPRRHVCGIYEKWLWLNYGYEGMAVYEVPVQPD